MIYFGGPLTKLKMDITTQRYGRIHFGGECSPLYADNLRADNPSYRGLPPDVTRVNVMENHHRVYALGFAFLACFVLLNQETWFKREEVIICDENIFRLVLCCCVSLVLFLTCSTPS